MFHGSSAMCCSHGDSKWHVGFARNTGAPPLLNNRPCSDLGDEVKVFRSQSVMSSTLKYIVKIYFHNLDTFV